MLAFIDDSKSNTANLEFTLAGYMATVDTWEAFNRDWTSVLLATPSIAYYHAVEGENLRGEFKGFAPAQRDLKVMRLVNIVVKHKLYSFDSRLAQSAFNCT
jgi:hypothetical protein